VYLCIGMAFFADQTLLQVPVMGELHLVEGNGLGCEIRMTFFAIRSIDDIRLG